MALAQARTAGGLGAAFVLCLVLWALGLSSPAFAHGGQDCGKAAIAAAAGAVAVVPAEAPVADSSITIAEANVHASIAQVSDQEAPVEVARPSFKNTFEARDVVLFTVGSVGSYRITCPCSSGCATGSGASCCVTAVLQPVFDWLFEGATIDFEIVAVPGTAGRSSDPLPRPPNSERLS